MDVLRIFGGVKLHGSMSVPSAKNAVMPILAAALLTDETVVLNDCPKLLDTQNMLRILETLGVRCGWEGRDITIDASTANSHEMPGTLSRALRSSIFLLGPLLGRFRKATVTYPGGCEIGLRPIDLHLKSLRTLGIRVREAHGMIYCDGSALKGGEIHLDFPSVGATENAMMAAVLAPGRTVIHNAAREPEIVDLERFINRMGGKISGSGSGVIVIDGVKKLHGCTYRPVPDRIVAGTLFTAAAITGGEVTLQNVVPEHMGAVLDKLRLAGCDIGIDKGDVSLRAPERLRPLEIVTQPFPGFPTDMQAQMMALCTIADGTSVVVENLFESRFSHASQLIRMGADIIIHDKIAIIRGGRLMGARVTARDLRGGAALVLAALAAEGSTEVDNTVVIDRGYERIEQMLKQLGANIERL